MSRRYLASVLVYTFQILILYFGYNCAREYGSLTLQGKIVGGSKAKISNFPHAVYLYINCGEGNTICGSSIVNQIVLITAAHCLQCKERSVINAHAGSDNLKQSHVVRKAVGKKSHPNFVHKSLINDIGLLLLSSNLPLGNNIKRVIIKTLYPQDATTYVAGWGVTDDVTRNRPLYLKKVEVPLHPRSDCSILGRIFPGMLCAGTIQSTKNRPSRGDSGSALITTDHQQLGIVSFRVEPHIALLVYTNVSYYYSWIKKTAKELYCSQKNSYKNLV